MIGRRLRLSRGALLVAIVLMSASCAVQDATGPTTEESPTTVAPTETTISAETSASSRPLAEPACAAPGSWGECELDGYRGRPYEVYVPSSYDPDVPVPVILALHGGGGRSKTAIETTCAGSDRAAPGCLHNIAEESGFVAVYPNGLGFGLKTWNAGGGVDGYNCASGQACTRNVDDISYFGALLDNLSSWLRVDEGRVFATGLSNGAAMAHRLACEMSERIAGIAAVGGANQFGATDNCEPSTPVAILQIHGTEDPCWTYEESDAACVDSSGGLKVGVEPSTEAWVERLGCDPAPVIDQPPDPVDDGTVTTRTRWLGCDGGVEVQLLSIEGGGHTWPGGDAYLPERRVGRVTQDWDSTVIWEFFVTQAR